MKERASIDQRRSNGCVFQGNLFFVSGDVNDKFIKDSGGHILAHISRRAITLSTGRGMQYNWQQSLAQPSVKKLSTT